MAIENLGKCVTLPASGDLSASQYRFMKVDSSGNAERAGDGENAVGVLQDDPAAAARGANLMVGVGITKVVAGGSVTAGQLVASDAQGRAVNAVSGDYILGVALQTTTVAGTIVKMLFRAGNSLL